LSVISSFDLQPLGLFGQAIGVGSGSRVRRDAVLGRPDLEDGALEVDEGKISGVGGGTEDQTVELFGVLVSVLGGDGSAEGVASDDHVLLSFGDRGDQVHSISFLGFEVRILGAQLDYIDSISRLGEGMRVGRVGSGFHHSSWTENVSDGSWRFGGGEEVGGFALGNVDGWTGLENGRINSLGRIAVGLICKGKVGGQHLGKSTDWVRLGCVAERESRRKREGWPVV